MPWRPRQLGTLDTEPEGAGNATRISLGFCLETSKRPRCLELWDPILSRLPVLGVQPFQILYGPVDPQQATVVLFPRPHPVFWGGYYGFVYARSFPSLSLLFLGLVGRGGSVAYVSGASLIAPIFFPLYRPLYR